MSLEQLKRIRIQRVRRVYTELQRAKTVYAQTELELQNAHDELNNYHHWRLQHEQELFDQLQSDFFSPSELGDYNIRLDRLKQREDELRNMIPVVEKRLEACRQEVVDAQLRLQKVTKDKEKVDEFLLMEEGEEKSIQEKQEEELVDEISCFKSSLR